MPVIRLSLLLCILLAGVAEASWTPQALCGLMRDEGFGHPPVRQERGGRWHCTSARRRLPQGEPAGSSDLRYRVRGDADGRWRATLELRMNAWRAPQGVLQRFHRDVTALLRRLGPEEPADLRGAILTPAPGEWTVGGHRLRLEKKFSHGAVYELWFSVEPAVSPPS